MKVINSILRMNVNSIFHKERSIIINYLLVIEYNKISSISEIAIISHSQVNRGSFI